MSHEFYASIILTYTGRPPSDLDTQDVFAPPPSTLDAPSVIPATSGSQFSLTPATSGTAYDGPEYGVEKHIDPTTLFVGGLDVSGPGAWDEGKVRTVFSRYGGLESVKFVRPSKLFVPKSAQHLTVYTVNATVAFAFVKFNNVEAPAHAVQEEV
jgi:hypothetical protein